MQMIKISAHRGGSEQARAATYEAYEHALTSGAEYAEFDIRRTADGILVVYHDPRSGPHGLSTDNTKIRNGPRRRSA